MQVKHSVRLPPLAVPLLLCVLCVMYVVSTGPAVHADLPPTFTASEIQQYIGVNEGDRVRFTGICTVESSVYGFSLTVACDPGGGEWSGIAIYDGIEQRLVADRSEWVEAVGIVEEYYDKTELNCSEEYEYPPAGLNLYGTLPPPISTTVASMNNGESMESCIIMLNNVEVVSDPDTFGNIAIHDGTAEGVVLFKAAEPVPPIGTLFECLRGNLDFHFGEFKLRPRDLDDRQCPPSPTATPTGNPCIHDGDVTLDGEVTAGDAQLAFLIALGSHTPSYEEACAADCNGDDQITAGDAQQIFLTALGLGTCIDSV